MDLILPEDKPVQPHPEPHNFFIWGATMSGKSYFSSFFPHPLSLNTDGNADQGTTPAVQIRNVRGTDGRLEVSAIEMLDSVVTQLQSGQTTFQTVIVDVIDDICVMIEDAICLSNGVQALSDIPYGKGYALFNTILQRLVINLKALPMDVIYVSREILITNESTGSTQAKPSLKTKYYNIVNGNCDLVIHTQKFGTETYTREVTDRRAAYKPENITNERVRQLLESCRNMFPVNEK